MIIVQENEYCQSERITIFIGIIYAYKGILLVRFKRSIIDLTMPITFLLIFTDIWSISGLGNSTRVNSGSQRLQTHRSIRIQRTDHVYYGSSYCPSLIRPQGRCIHINFTVYNILYDWNVVFGVRSESKTGSNLLVLDVWNVLHALNELTASISLMTNVR